MKATADRQRQEEHHPARNGRRAVQQHVLIGVVNRAQPQLDVTLVVVCFQNWNWLLGCFV